MGSNTSETLIQSFLMLASKAIGMVVKANDVQALQKDLQEDFVIKSTLLNRVAREAATNQKPPAAAAEEKKKRQKTPAAESAAICLLALEAWLSSLWRLLSTTGDYGELRLPAKLGRLRRSQSQSQNQAAISN